MTKPESIPDIMFNLVTPVSFSILTVPLFLIVLYYCIHPYLDINRIVRYKNRKQLFSKLLFSLLITTILFVIFYIVIGFLYGWLVTKSLSNPYNTMNGVPYILYGDEIDLDWFNTPYMIFRILSIEISAFLVIGILCTIFFILIKNFVFAFFIVESLLLIDLSLASLNINSFFTKYAVISISNWGGFNQLFGILLYFSGVSIILLIILYITITKIDFLPDIRESR